MKTFKPIDICKKTIDETYFELMYAVAQYGRKYEITEGSMKGDYRLELDKVSGTILEPIQYLDSGEKASLAVTVPPGCPIPTTNQKIFEYFNNYLLDNKLSPNEHYKYSTWITGGEYKLPLCNEYISLNDYRDDSGIENILINTKNKQIIAPNQLEWCINHYSQYKNGKFNFGNNHCCIQIGYPESNLAYDLPYNNEMERGTSPCLRMIDTKIIEEENKYYLCFYVYHRCLSGKTPLLFKSEGEIQFSNLNDIYKEFMKQKRLEVMSINENNDPIWANVTNVSRVFKKNIKTLTILGVGELEATEEHKFPVYKNGEIKNIPVSEIQIGDFILEGKEFPKQKDNNTFTIDLLHLLKNETNCFLYPLTLDDFSIFKKENIKYENSYRDNKKIPIFKIINSSYEKNYKGTIKCKKIVVNRYFEISEELAYLMGVWLSDGWYSTQKSLRIAISDTKPYILNRVTSFLNKEFDYKPSLEKRDGCVVLNISIPFLYKLFKNMGFEHGAKIKSIPSIFFQMPYNILASFVSGWLDGDGGTTSSQQLAVDFAYIFKLISESISIHKEKPRKTFFEKENRTIESGPCFRVYLLNKNTSTLQWDKFYLRKVTNISNVYKSGFVYDLSVDSFSHLFYCGNTPILTHNSWDCLCGWPENIGGVALLQEYMANAIEIKTGVEIHVGPLSFESKGLHVYGSYVDALKLKVGSSSIREIW